MKTPLSNAFGRLLAGALVKGEFEEAEHPRDERGRFAEAGSGGEDFTSQAGASAALVRLKEIAALHPDLGERFEKAVASMALAKLMITGKVPLPQGKTISDAQKQWRDARNEKQAVRDEFAKRQGGAPPTPDPKPDPKPKPEPKAKEEPPKPPEPPKKAPTPADGGPKSMAAHKDVVVKVLKTEKMPARYRGVVEKEMVAALAHEGPVGGIYMYAGDFLGPMPQLKFGTPEYEKYWEKRSKLNEKFDKFREEMDGKSPGEIMRRTVEFSKSLPEESRGKFVEETAKKVVGKVLARRFAPTELPKAVPQYSKAFISAAEPKRLKKAEGLVSLAQQAFAAWVVKDKWPMNVKVRVKQQPASKFRAHASHVYGEISISYNERPGVVGHELAHHIEFNDPQVFEVARAFRDSRGRGPAGRLKGYRSNEHFLQDEFVNPYVGKVYPQKSTEVVSMGVEYLTPNSEVTVERLRERAEIFAEKDPEHFLVTMMAIGRLKTEAA